MGEMKFWQRLFAAGLLLFWLVMLPIFLVTGERAFGRCLSNLAELDFSGCLSSLAATGATYLILKWGTVLLLGAFVLVTLFRIAGERRPRQRGTRHEEDDHRTVEGPF